MKSGGIRKVYRSKGIMMDINTLGIGAIIGATFVATTNLYIFISNRHRDEIKERLKNFYNEVLARPWDEETEQIDTKGMIDRKEDYEAQVPKGVRVLTAGADVQKDRIECEVVGWGLNFESWSIEYIIFQGDTTQPEVWDRFRDFLIAKRWYNHDGLPVAIYSACVDAGYRTETVTNFTTPLHDRRIYAIMGANSVQAKFIPKKAGKTKTKDVFFSLGVNRGKDELSWHIKSKSGAGYMHFPNNPMYDHEYFNQLGAEAKDKTGRWIPCRKRNEVFDKGSIYRIFFKY